MADHLGMFGSTLRCEHLITDQAEAQVVIENSEDFADLIGVPEHCSLDVVKHARFSGSSKHELPILPWLLQPEAMNGIYR
jgi:hypothetical protein